MRVLAPGTALGPLDAFRQAGGVVEYVLVEADGEPNLHRRAAVAGVAELCTRAGEASRSMAESLPVDLRRRWKALEFSTNEAGARSEPIDLASFLGRCYDLETRKLTSAWRPDGKGGGHKIGTTDGYAAAFVDPPYRVRAPLAQLQSWFDAINRQLLGGLDDGLEIESWSTDWSTWFDAGHEWWGSFLWSARRPGLPWVTVMAASTTD